jgi:hypothetical protein
MEVRSSFLPFVFVVALSQHNRQFDNCATAKTPSSYPCPSFPGKGFPAPTGPYRVPLARASARGSFLLDALLRLLFGLRLSVEVEIMTEEKKASVDAKSLLITGLTFEKFDKKVISWERKKFGGKY